MPGKKVTIYFRHKNGNLYMIVSFCGKLGCLSFSIKPSVYTCYLVFGWRRHRVMITNSLDEGAASRSFGRGGEGSAFQGRESALIGVQCECEVPLQPPNARTCKGSGSSGLKTL